jgi:RNA-directed DNA polymerase
MRATDKPFNIDKKLVYEAYKAVKSNGGAAGVDGQTIEQFEADLKSNLYKIWKRMSSGATFLRQCAPSPFPRENRHSTL